MTTPNNLPAELTSFVGREPQLAELRRLLHRSRLITLTGPGGAGKTRLALRLASGHLDRFPGGVWLVELASVSDARLLEQTVSFACGIREEKGRPLIEALIDGLAALRTLLILDSTEHLVDGSAALASQLLRSCRELSIIVTGREPLGVPGETIWRTPSLTVPRPSDAAQPELVLQSEAVRLFVERTRLNRPAFELDQTTSAPVAQICSRLEGIPLAIELAAGLTGTTTMTDIVDGLSDRFRLLTGGSRASLPRHQTLRHAVDWSYRLLRESDQRLFITLTAFAGGFDVAAVEAVTAGLIEKEDVRPSLQRLVDKSLVMTDPARLGPTRYEMLETIREFGLEKLHELGEPDVRRRHAEYFVRWLDEAIQKLETKEQNVWLQRIVAEQANVRLALEWTLVAMPEAALRLATSMGSFTVIRGLYREDIHWLDRALETPAPPSLARAIALRTRARLRRRRGEFDAAAQDAEASIELCRRLGDKANMGKALTVLAVVESSRGDHSEAMRLHVESLALAQASGDPRRVAMSLNNIALLSLVQGDAVGARRRILEALQEIEKSGDRWTWARLVESLARIEFQLGNLDASEARYFEALRVCAELQDPDLVAECCDGLGLVAVTRRNPRRAMMLFGVAAGLYAKFGSEPPTEFSQRIAQGLSLARSQLGMQAADVAWNEGESLSLNQALDLAMGTPRHEADNGSSPLTAREMQVAKCIVDGMTNGQIGARLKIATRTVDAHVEHIRNKLGLRTRAQIAVWTKDRLGKG